MGSSLLPARVGYGQVSVEVTSGAVPWVGVSGDVGTVVVWGQHETPYGFKVPARATVVVTGRPLGKPEAPASE